MFEEEGEIASRQGEVDYFGDDGNKNRCAVFQ
jgi:hypothetical protein